MAAFIDAHRRLSSSSNRSVFELPNTFSNRVVSFENDIEMEDLSDGEPMDYESTPAEDIIDPVARVRQVEEDEKFAILLQLQFDAEVPVSFGRRFNGRERRFHSSVSSSRWPQYHHIQQRLQSIQEDLQTISLRLGTWTPFFAEDNFEDSFESLLQISIEIGDHSVGLKKREIDALPIRKFSSSQSRNSTSNGSSSQDCPVCLSEYGSEDMLRTLPCCHEFHVACIDKWLKSHNSCPICRNKIGRQHV